MFEKEKAYFDSIKNELIQQKHEGKFALIKGDSLLNTFSTFEEAYNAGVQNFGKEQFFIKIILKGEEPPENIPALTYGLINASF